MKKRVTVILAALVAVIAGVAVVLLQSSSRLLADHKSVSPQNKKHLSQMDTEFVMALHEYLSGDFSNAFSRLDGAIERFEPTDRWYLYLPLYRACFDKVTKSPYLDHSEMGLKMIKKMGSEPKKSATTLVKLCILLPCIEVPYTAPVHTNLQELVARHADSPWSKWARWREIEMEAQRLDDQAACACGLYGIADAVISSEMKCALEPREDGSRAVEPIMLRWMVFRLCSGIRMSLIDVGDRLAVCTEYGVSDSKVRQLAELCPRWVDCEVRLVHMLCEHDDFEKEEILSSFYEFMRADFESLPACIPRSKSALSRLYNKAEGVKPSGNNN